MRLYLCLPNACTALPKEKGPAMTHETKLAKAEKAILNRAATLRDRWYPAYHIAARAGWINDPNGLCFYKGRYHAYFQHHPYSSEWGPMHWGHVSSEDLVTWRHEPIALAPTLEEECNGCWSGSAVVGDDGRLYFFYTGHRHAIDFDHPETRREVQCAAVSDDGVHWEKLGVVVPGDKPRGNFRDPKVWRQGNVWCMVVGQQSSEPRGQVALYTSRDLRTWQCEGVIYEWPTSEVRMIECPDLFCLGGRWVLCFSAMGMRPKGYVGRNYNNAGYLVGDWSLGKPFVPTTDFTPCDWGHNFYAPQSFETPDGRRIQFGWMSPFQFEAPEKADGWCGQFTLPRELTLGDDDRVRVRPAKEVMEWTRSHGSTSAQMLETSLNSGAGSPTIPSSDVRAASPHSSNAVTCSCPAFVCPIALAPNTEHTLASDLTCGLIELVFDLITSDAERMGVEVHHTSDGNRLFVGYDAQTGCVVVDRRNTIRGNRGYRAVPVNTRDGRIRLQVWLDRGCVEVYVNDGEAAMSELSYPGDGPRSVVLTSESGTTHVCELAMHRLA